MPTPPSERGVLVIALGDLPSLVALRRETVRRELAFYERGEAANHEAGPLIAWVPTEATGVTRVAAQSAGAWCEAETLAEPASLDHPLPAALLTSQPAQMLLRASAAARTRGLGRVVWPVQIDPTQRSALEHISDAFDRATLITQLASIGLAPGEQPPAIEAPLIDLTDEQLVTLAVDLDTPWMPAPGRAGMVPASDAASPLAWWCEAAQSAPNLAPCAVCVSCRRWLKAFELVRPPPLPPEVVTTAHILRSATPARR